MGRPLGPVAGSLEGQSVCWKGKRKAGRSGCTEIGRPVGPVAGEWEGRSCVRESAKGKSQRQVEYKIYQTSVKKQHNLRVHDVGNIYYDATPRQSCRLTTIHKPGKEIKPKASINIRMNKGERNEKK